MIAVDGWKERCQNPSQDCSRWMERKVRGSVTGLQWAELIRGSEAGQCCFVGASMRVTTRLCESCARHIE